MAVPPKVARIHPPLMSDLNTTLHLPAARRRRSSRRRGPLFASIFFCLLGLGWMALMVLALKFLRPHPLTTSDYIVGSVGIALAGFYFWVALAVFQRRKYILTAAFVCAGFGLLNFPIGTALSILLMSDLAARKHEFTK